MAAVPHGQVYPKYHCLIVSFLAIKWVIFLVHMIVSFLAIITHELGLGQDMEEWEAIWNDSTVKLFDCETGNPNGLNQSSVDCVLIGNHTFSELWWLMSTGEWNEWTYIFICVLYGCDGCRCSYSLSYSSSYSWNARHSLNKTFLDWQGLEKVI